MFCNKCGKQLPDGTKFCNGCGNALGGAAPTPAAQPVGNQAAPVAPAGGVVGDVTATVKNMQKNTLIGVGVVGVVVLIAIIALLSMLLGGSSPEKLTKKALNAFYGMDAHALIELTNEDAMIEMIDWYGYDDDELEDFVDDYLQDNLEWEVEYIADYIGEDEDDLLDFVTFDIDDADVYDEKDDEYEDLEDAYDDMDIEIKGVCSVDWEAEFEGDDDDYDEDGTFYFVKIGSKWYLDMYN